MLCSSLTDFKNWLYTWRFFSTAPLTIWLKDCRSSSQTTHLSRDSTDAARGQLYSKASSPKTSPTLQVFTTISSPSGFLMIQSRQPSSIMYKQLPSSPWLMIRVFGSSVVSFMAPRITPSSLAPRAENMKLFCRIALRRAVTSSLFAKTGGVKVSSFLFHSPYASALTEPRGPFFMYVEGGGGISSTTSSSSSSSESASDDFLSSSLASAAASPCASAAADGAPSGAADVASAAGTAAAVASGLAAMAATSAPATACSGAAAAAASGAGLAVASSAAAGATSAGVASGAAAGAAVGSASFFSSPPASAAAWGAASTAPVSAAFSGCGDGSGLLSAPPLVSSNAGASTFWLESTPFACLVLPHPMMECARASKVPR
mmetsp:Transcript_7761/g.18889  ORF Transcript_7761/g.18889 Transcript_7761/m.18889 type:complete len:375 (-) Transcript_7761:28-1152(-)